MTKATEAYEEGKEAYSNHLDTGDNPYYTSFGDLPPEFNEWINGWEDAQEAWYAWIGESESQDWQNYLAEQTDD